MISGYSVPFTLMNPYLAGAIFVDYLVRERYPPIPQHPFVLSPDRMQALTGEGAPPHNPDVAGVQSGATLFALRPTSAGAESPGLKAIVDTHE